MNKPALLFCFSILLSTLSVVAQHPVAVPSATPTPAIIEEDDEVLRINTNLVQIQAIVKDNNGKIIDNLKAEDFEIIEETGVRQPDFFSYIQTNGEGGESRFSDNRISPNQLRRTFVFLIGNPAIDYSYFFHDRNGFRSGTIGMRKFAITAAETTSRFLNKFINEQMGERDLVAVVDTEKDLGLLSSFTNDREVLRAAVKQMKNNVPDYSINRLTTVNQDLNVHDLIQQNLTVLETAGNAVAQLKKLPGRKIVVLISRALLYNTRLSGTEIIKTRLNQLIEQANQAEVTFYFINPAGLGLQPSGAAQKLAEETGGRSIYNTNDPSFGFTEILKENSGYYLLGYDPGQETPRQQRQIKVRVKNPDFQVQTRSTVYKNETISENADARESLLRILRSPLAAADIKITLSPTLEPLTKTGGVIKSLLKIDSANLEVETLGDGTHSVKVMMAIQVTGPDNKLLREDVKNYNLRLSNETWNKIRSEGLTYQFETPVKQIGYYRVNAGVCVADTKRCASASRFISASQNK